LDEWYAKLQELLRQAVKSSTSQDWLRENEYISSDILNIEGKFEVERFEYSETK